MSSEILDTHQELVKKNLGNAHKFFNDKFLGKKYNVLHSYEIRIHDINPQFDDYDITSIEILGVCNTVPGLLYFDIFITFSGCCKSVVIIFCTHINEKIACVNHTDMNYCDTIINYENNLELLGIYDVNYFKRYYENIIIIHFTSDNGYFTLRKYESLFAIYDFYFSKWSHERFRCYDRKHSINIGYILIRGRGPYIDIKNNVNGSIKHHIEFNSNKNTIEKFNKALITMFIDSIYIFDDKETKIKLIEILREISNRCGYLLPGLVNIYNTGKESSELFMLDEMEIIKNVSEILLEKSIEITNRESLPLLLMRAVVYEHTLLLFRRLTQA